MPNRQFVALAATFIIASAFVVMAPAHSAQAATFTVTTLGDSMSVDGACTLREAIVAANTDAPSGDCAAGAGSDTITFAVSGPILLTSTLPIVTDPAGLTIDGNGQDIILDGDIASRVLQSSAPLTLRNLTLTRATNSAIYAGGGVLTVESTSFLANSAPGGGAAIVASTATVHISQSTFIGNTSGSFGGAVYMWDSVGSTIRNSTFTDNATTAGAGRGGAFYAAGVSSVSVVNSTITENSSANGGGFWVQGTLTLANTILYGNSATVAGPDCSVLTGPASSTGSNVIGSTVDCTITTTATDLIGVDPMLAPISDNGGPVQTFALQQGSPAVDAGNTATCEATDARGITRPQGTGCDIGAYEALQLTVAGVTAAEGAALAFPVTLSSALPAGFADVTVTYTTADGTSSPATAGTDYTPVTASALTFTAGGPVTQTATVATATDTVVEADETVLVTLASASGAVVAGGAATGVITGTAAPALLPPTGADVTPLAIGGSILLLLGMSSLAFARARRAGSRG